MRTLPFIIALSIGGLSFAQEAAPAAASIKPAMPDYNKMSEEEKGQAYNECVEKIMIDQSTLNKEEFAKLVALADSNYAQAVDTLAACYLDGVGVAADEKKAFELYNKAATLGHAPSAHQLVNFLLTGTGCDPDAARAVRVLQQLITVKKNFSAAATLGDLYLSGSFGYEDHVAAAAWYQYGMLNGNNTSCLKYATCLIEGTGVTQDIAKGTKILQQLIDEKKDGAACRAMGLLYWRGIGVEKNQQEAMAWFRKGAGMGDIDASRSLGIAYRDAEGELRKPSIALSILTDLSYNGDTSAMLSAAEMLLTDNSGVKKDVKKAYKLLEMGMQEGDLDCSMRLGKGLYYGTDGEKDIKKGLEIISLCAEQGSEEAALIVVEALRTGENDQKTADPKQAHEVLLQLDAQGSTRAPYELYLDFKEGRGVEVNPAKAEEFLRKAKELNDPRAQ